MPVDFNANLASKHLNQLSVEDKSVHDWYRFVLSFPPHLVSHYLRKFQATPDNITLDPFSGTGTTLVECKKLGFACVGIEANPMAHFASQTKLNWSIPTQELIEHSQVIAQLVNDELAILQHGVLYPSLCPDAQKLLLKDAISQKPLQKVLTLLGYIDAHRHPTLHGHERLALAKTAVQASNLRFAPEVSVARHHKIDAPVVASWLNAVHSMASDLGELRHLSNGLGGNVSATVHLGDARMPAQYLTKESVDIVITSPPYPNEKDYTRATRLESVLLGFLGNRADLQSVKKTLLRSNSRGIYTQDDDDRLVENYSDVLAIAEAIENRRQMLGKTSGFSRVYGRAVRLYFGGMVRHLANLRTVLRPGAQLAYVVGDQASYLRVYIPTGKILADIAQSLGYQLLGVDLFRTRRASKTEVNLREEVVLLKWIG